MAYTVNPMLIKGKKDESAGYWGALVGSILGGLGTAAGTAVGGPAVGGAVGGAAGGIGGRMTTSALDDSTPDRYTQQTPAYAPSQNPEFQALLRRLGLA